MHSPCWGFYIIFSIHNLFTLLHDETHHAIVKQIFTIHILFMKTILNQNIQRLLSQHTATAAELARSLQISQPTLSRALSSMGAAIVKIGRGKTTRYGLVKTQLGRPARDPLYVIDKEGRAEQIATLTRLESGETYVVSNPDQIWLLGSNSDGLFDDLPYYLLDMQPQGYLGRLIARSLAPAWPADLMQWQSSHISEYLLTHGHDTPGNLLFGELRSSPPVSETTVAENERAQAYENLATATIAGAVPGSSAGGEQPKFLATLRSNDGSTQRVIVKFSPPLDTPVGRRWADLLAMERLAFSTLAHAGIPAAKTHLITADRAYLEIERFDRIGRHGRAPMISLSAIDAEFVGGHVSWRATAEALLDQSRIDRTTADQIILLDYFGELIANTDRHFHNLSLAPTDMGTFQLGPVYDMLPMYYAPRHEVVELPPRHIVPRKNDALWDRAATLAMSFWQTAQADKNVSSEFKRFIHAELTRSN